MKTFFLKAFIVLVTLYVMACLLLYFFQEKLIFFPEKLDPDFRFNFNQTLEEVNFKTPDGVILNAVLFKATDPHGLIFYLHGNAGSINSWGTVANTYTGLNYDVVMLDYRGFGKSGGKISSERQFFDDVQLVYDAFKPMYGEEKMIILGYSVGTGPAAYLAANNHPAQLILQAPYYSLVDLVKKLYPVLPSMVLKYKFETNKYLADCKMPVTIFHGDQDEVIYYNSSIKLQQHLKKNDAVIILKGEGHMGMTENKEYLEAIKKRLE